MMKGYKNGSKWLEHIHASGGPLYYDAMMCETPPEVIVPQINCTLQFPEALYFLKKL